MPDVVDKVSRKRVRLSLEGISIIRISGWCSN